MSFVINLNNLLYRTSINGIYHDTKVHVLSDNSGFIILGINTSSKFIACKCLTSCTCQSIISFTSAGLGQLKLSDNQFFFIATDSTTSLHFWKLTFGSSAIDWSKTMTCSVGSCTSTNFESLLSSDSSKIYSIYAYGNPQYLYFITLNSTDGSVIGTRYKSTISWLNIYGSAEISNYLIVTIKLASSAALFVFDTTAIKFTFKSFSGTVLYQIAQDPTSGR